MEQNIARGFSCANQTAFHGCAPQISSLLLACANSQHGQELVRGMRRQTRAAGIQHVPWVALDDDPTRNLLDWGDGITTVPLQDALCAELAKKHLLRPVYCYGQGGERRFLQASSSSSSDVHV